tara:strand:+ start:1267 stop:2943 length:1677 start_codon:yes stop_codon:yes gene_type:complete
MAVRGKHSRNFKQGKNLSSGIKNKLTDSDTGYEKVCFYHNDNYFNQDWYINIDECNNDSSCTICQPAQHNSLCSSVCGLKGHNSTAAAFCENKFNLPLYDYETTPSAGAYSSGCWPDTNLCGGSGGNKWVYWIECGNPNQSQSCCDDPSICGNITDSYCDPTTCTCEPSSQLSSYDITISATNCTTIMNMEDGYCGRCSSDVPSNDLNYGCDHICQSACNYWQGHNVPIDESRCSDISNDTYHWLVDYYCTDVIPDDCNIYDYISPYNGQCDCDCGCNNTCGYQETPGFWIQHLGICGCCEDIGEYTCWNGECAQNISYCPQSPNIHPKENMTMGVRNQCLDVMPGSIDDHIYSTVPWARSLCNAQSGEGPLNPDMCHPCPNNGNPDGPDDEHMNHFWDTIHGVCDNHCSNVCNLIQYYGFDTMDEGSNNQIYSDLWLHTKQGWPSQNYYSGYWDEFDFLHTQAGQIWQNNMKCNSFPGIGLYRDYDCNGMPDSHQHHHEYDDTYWMNAEIRSVIWFNSHGGEEPHNDMFPPGWVCECMPCNCCNNITDEDQMHKLLT